MSEELLNLRLLLLLKRGKLFLQNMDEQDLDVILLLIVYGEVNIILRNK